MSSKYRLSRLGKKLQVSDDQRVLIALPRDVPERTWAEILLKEENDLIVLEIREEIIEEALKIYYERYMERQNACFTAHCAYLAWMKLINCYFFRHDPGEDPTSYPPCAIPKRIESWTPDELPEPSPKDSCARHDLDVLEEVTAEEVLRKWPSNSSLDYPIVKEIKEKYWFPGKIQIEQAAEEKLQKTYTYETTESSDKSAKLLAESEVLQKVTDYSTEELISKDSKVSALRPPSLVNDTLGGGDTTFGSGDVFNKLKKKKYKESSVFRKSTLHGRSKVILPPLKTVSTSVTLISDCRLRNPRAEIQYEVSTEKMQTPPLTKSKRK